MRRCLASVIAAPCRHVNFQVSATSKGGWWSGEGFVFLAACSADDVMAAGGGRTRDEVVTAKDGDAPEAALGCQIERSRFFATLLRATVICESDSRAVNYCSNCCDDVRRICSTQALAIPLGIGQQDRRKSWQCECSRCWDQWR